MKRYLICPVRKRTHNEQRHLEQWVCEREAVGDKVYFPGRDTGIEELPENGMLITEKNLERMEWCEIVDLWYEVSSQGSSFDLGLAFSMDIKIYFPWRNQVEWAAEDGDGFACMLLEWEKRQ